MKWLEVGRRRKGLQSLLLLLPILLCSCEYFGLYRPEFETAATVVLTRPSAGELLVAGSAYRYYWETENISQGASEFFDVAYSIDGGTTWVQFAGVSNDGSDIWHIPGGIDSSSCKLRIVSRSYPAVFAISDTFEISQSVLADSVLLIGPTSGEILTAGTTYEYRWETRGSVQVEQMPPFVVDYSADGGTSWSRIALVEGYVGTGKWRVPDGISSDYCQLRIVSAYYSEVLDISDTFTIVPAPKTLSSVAVSGASTIDENTSANYTCTAYFSDGSNSDVTGSASWSENSSYTSISSSGQLYVNSVSSDKTCTVTGRYTYNGVSKSASKSVTLRNVSIPLPPTPTPTSPGTTSQYGPVINTLRPALQWNGVSGADHYVLGISKYPFGSSNLVMNPQVVAGTSYMVPSGVLEYGERYRWNMQAVNESGSSSISNTLYFQTPAAPGLQVGDRIQVIQNLNVRQCAVTSCLEISDSDYLGFAPIGTQGTVVDGPEYADGYVWWQIQFDAGYTGWSVENGLDEL